MFPLTTNGQPGDYVVESAHGGPRGTPGFHIVLHHRPPRAPCAAPSKTSPGASARGSARNKLDQAQEAAMRSLSTRLRAATPVQIDEAALAQVHVDAPPPSATPTPVPGLMVPPPPAPPSTHHFCARKYITSPMRPLRRLSWLAPLFALTTAVFSPRPARAEVLERVAAVLNEDAIFLSDVMRRARPFLAEAQAIRDPARRETQRQLALRTMLDRMIDDSLIRAAATRNHITLDDAQVDELIQRVADQNHVTVEEALHGPERRGAQPRRVPREP